MSALAPADFSERLVPRSAKASQAPDRGAEAHDASAAFYHYTESLRELFRMGACEKTAPAATPQAPAGAVCLSDHAMILLRAVSAYENCANEDAIVLALADYVRKIGAGPLARAVLDERERTAARDTVKNIPDDLSDLPEFVRSDDVRFDGAQKTLRNDSRRLRR